MWQTPEDWGSSESSESLTMRFVVCAIYLLILVMPMASGWWVWILF